MAGNILVKQQDYESRDFLRLPMGMAMHAAVLRRAYENTIDAVPIGYGIQREDVWSQRTAHSAIKGEKP